MALELVTILSYVYCMPHPTIVPYGTPYHWSLECRKCHKKYPEERNGTKCDCGGPMSWFAYPYTL